MSAQSDASGPDFSAGVPFQDLPHSGTLSGRVGNDPVLLTRRGEELFAVSGMCTHYGAMLSSGLVVGETIRCPLHHACFSLRTGAALRAPALDPLDLWQVDVERGMVFVRRKLDMPAKTSPALSTPIERVVIIGGGAAGLACAHELRVLGYDGAITILSAEQDGPCDRPNLSKDYLAGTAPEEWLPLRDERWYDEQRVDLRLGVEVQRIDSVRRLVHYATGDLPFDRLLIATGSEPNRLLSPGFEHKNVFTLRSIADARAIASRAQSASRATIIGSSFIGLEAAAALRKQHVEVAIVSPEHVPFEHLFGTEVGRWLQQLHERNGVHFHLGTVGARFDGQIIKLANGSSVDTDFVLVGIGVRPRTNLAEAAGIPAQGGVPVDTFLETCLSGIFAAGDVAVYPDPLTGVPVRIEHWVTAERQGQIAAANMLGQKRPFNAVPFFWTEQYGVAIRYVGHAARWDEVDIEGSVERGDFIARYYDQGTHRASAAVGRELELLKDERRFEAMIAEALKNRPDPRAQLGLRSTMTSVEAVQ